MDIFIIKIKKNFTININIKIMKFDNNNIRIAVKL